MSSSSRSSSSKNEELSPQRKTSSQRINEHMVRSMDEFKRRYFPKTYESDKIKEAIDKGDFEKAGELLADKIWNKNKHILGL